MFFDPLARLIARCENWEDYQEDTVVRCLVPSPFFFFSTNLGSISDRFSIDLGSILEIQ
jgi:hypothetical protein